MERGRAETKHLLQLPEPHLEQVVRGVGARESRVELASSVAQPSRAVARVDDRGARG